MIKLCAECGKEFESDGNTRYCCDECRLIGYKKKTDARKVEYAETAKKKREAYVHHKKEKHKSRINELNAKARELGLTYGQYQAMKFKEAQNGTNRVDFSS